MTEPRKTAGAEPDMVPLAEERMTVSKQAVVTGTVKVSTRTETHDEWAEMALERSVVDVSRVPVGRTVDTVPSVRTEGDTTIVPIVEERMVVVKQLYLKEELHIRHHVETEVSRTKVGLRRQHAVIERDGPDGQATGEDDEPSLT